MMSAPEWASLSDDERRIAAAKLLAAYVAVGRRRFSGGRYNIVSGPTTDLRPRARIEYGGEDTVLTATLRNQFCNLARDGVRNNETLNGLLVQFDANVVGTVGGLAYFDFPAGYDRVAALMEDAFSASCESADYYDGYHFDTILRLTLRTLLLGGGVVLLYDDARVVDSGAILSYEPDCIANISDSAFRRRFPAGWSQSNGRIRNADGRWCGVIVSQSQRGKTEFDAADRCYILTRDPSEPPLSAAWRYIGIPYRLNQGGGKSPLTAGLASLIDTQMLQGYEIEAAKKNAQTLAQIYQTQPDPPVDPSLYGEGAPTEFERTEDPDQIADAVAQAQAEQPPQVTLDEIRAAGCVYDIMPENARMELLDTKHPNPNMPEFIRQVACRGGWSLGMSSVYTTGKVDSSYTGYRGEQLMSWRTFRAWQKFLEREICDWYVRRWHIWASRRGLAPAESELPPGWRRMVRWMWPTMEEVDAKTAQDANNMGLKNGTRSYLDILGPRWRDQLRQRAAERDYLRSIGYPDPADETVSGQRIDDTLTGDNA